LNEFLELAITFFKPGNEYDIPVADFSAIALLFALEEIKTLSMIVGPDLFFPNKENMRLFE
jgi:hypothetical protein